jgi:hypothetical protein
LNDVFITPVDPQSPAKVADGLIVLAKVIHGYATTKVELSVVVMLTAGFWGGKSVVIALLPVAEFENVGKSELTIANKGDDHVQLQVSNSLF